MNTDRMQRVDPRTRELLERGRSQKKSVYERLVEEFAYFLVCAIAVYALVATLMEIQRVRAPQPDEFGAMVLSLFLFVAAVRAGVWATRNKSFGVLARPQSWIAVSAVLAFGCFWFGAANTYDRPFKWTDGQWRLVAWMFIAGAAWVYWRFVMKAESRGSRR